MIVLDAGVWAQELVSSSLLVGLPVAMLAGLVSFFSPCVVPLLPGYLSFASGLGASEIVADRGPRGRPRGRLLAGVALFVLGFAAVFVITGAIAGGVGRLLLEWQPLLTRILGVVVIALGAMFAGWLPLGRRELRWQRLPKVGVASAPLLGVVFGLGWTPCIGPTLAVVLSMAYTTSSAVQGGVLAFAYALGLGIPFVVAAVAFTRMNRVVQGLRRHQQLIMRAGGVVMIIIGISMVSGLWNLMIAQLRSLIAVFPVLI